MFTVFGFYKFQQIKKLKKNQKTLNNFLINNNIYGSVIISKEGINGSVSGKNNDIKNCIIQLKKIFSIKNFDSFNTSKSKFYPFHKPKVKIKKEVVPMDLRLSNRVKKKQSYIEPKKWNNLIKDKKTFLLDARKPFENKIGSFEKSGDGFEAFNAACSCGSSLKVDNPYFFINSDLERLLSFVFESLFLNLFLLPISTLFFNYLDVF